MKKSKLPNYPFVAGAALCVIAAPAFFINKTMSEELKLPIVNITVNEEEQNKKILAWGAFGKALYHSDLTLQAQAQEIQSKLIEPTSPELILSAEQAHAIVKKSLQKLQQSRIAITSKFDPVVARLSSHEKALQSSLDANYQAILKAKQAEKEAAKTKEAKEKELIEIEKRVLIYVADMHASYLNAHLALLSKAYDHALGINLSIENLPEFKAKLCNRVNIDNCTTPMPKPEFKYNTQADVDAHVLKCFHPTPPQELVTGFAQAVESKFSDWEHALKNKAAAKELHDKEVKDVGGEINKELEKLKITAGLNALAVPVSDNSIIAAGKPLKEVWQIEEPKTIEQMFLIVNAFAVNRNLVEHKLKANVNPANIGIKQMIAALVAVKNSDENFECTGIVFNKIDKL